LLLGADAEIGFSGLQQWQRHARHQTPDRFRLSGKRVPGVTNRLARKTARAVPSLGKLIETNTVQSADQEEASMRSQMVAFLLVAAASLGAIRAASAQSPYSYPYCSVSPQTSGSTSACYYASLEQCQATMSGIGGSCYPSPYYHREAVAPPRPDLRRHHAVVRPRRGGHT
jgi:hypothetical protein